MTLFGFSLEAQDGGARAGLLQTPHGKVETPVFMPVGTAGSVKMMSSEDLKKSAVSILLGNTYHLSLRPGVERIAELGGLHRFMNWDRSLLTDSGGFQIMSLSQFVKIEEEGASFRSHLDGSLLKLSPESCAEAQYLLGSDIQMPLDECIAYPSGEARQREAMERSLRWGARAREAFLKKGAEEKGMALFGIVQGGMEVALRESSARALQEIGFEGYAIGGLSVGEGHEMMIRTLKATLPFLPESAPRYLMGAGRPRDILEAVRLGVDMFDCVLPTREARHGNAYVPEGRINLKNAAFADDPAPLDRESALAASQHYSRAYLHHLFKAGEPSGPMLLTQHNIEYFQRLMQGARRAILEGAYPSYCETILSQSEKTS